MFVGWRDILFAKGRFTLIGATVALITLLLVMLTGLTGGLGNQNTDALEKIPADTLVFAPSNEGGAASFTDSQITAGLLNQWQSAEGMTSAEPLGVSTGRLEAGSAVSMTLFSLPEGSATVGEVSPLREGSLPADGEILLPATTAQDAGAQVGDTVTFSGTDLVVSGIAEDTFYSHTLTGWATTATWQNLTHQRTLEGDEAVVGTVMLAEGSADVEALASETGTQAITPRESFNALPAYTSERGSLLTMQGFLYGISALVIISFLTVWTIQRTRDIAVMRALGASQGFLTRDALTQTAVILAAGVAFGALTGFGLGALAANAVPFQLTTLTVLAPAAGIWALGMAGSLFALQKVAKVDPMIALGGN